MTEHDQGKETPDCIGGDGEQHHSNKGYRGSYAYVFVKEQRDQMEMPRPTIGYEESEYSKHSILDIRSKLVVSHLQYIAVQDMSEYKYYKVLLC